MQPAHCRAEALPKPDSTSGALGDQMQFASPVQNLLPPGTKPELQFMVIETEIAKMMSQVQFILNHAGIGTAINYNSRRQASTPQTYDVITNYFDLPEESRRESFEIIMRLLDRGIGDYEALKAHAVRRKFNPLHWMTWLVRLPLTLMEHAGLLGHDKMREAVIGWYGKFLQFLMGALLLLACIVLGLKVPWKEILASLVQRLLTSI